MTGEEHRFDRLARRLARRQTRGQVLKSAAVAALALPFARAGSAGAARPGRSTDSCRLSLIGGPTACRKGCNYTSHIQYESHMRGCNVLAGSTLVSALAGVFAGPAVLLQGPTHVLNQIRCQNAALENQQAMQSRCLQPDCPGFDPCASGGPCDSCTAYCSPCANRPDGYNCCSQPPKDGKSPCCG
jgi:hypothetical protein